MSRSDYLLCELCRSKVIHFQDRHTDAIVICAKCWGDKQNVIVTVDAAMDLVLAAKYAEGIFRRACEKWKMSEGAKQMFCMAAKKLAEAQESWRKDRKVTAPVSVGVGIVNE